jgi:hypothetical protein
MLVEAKQQGNLPGALGIDSLPQAGRVYVRPKSGNQPSGETSVGGSGDTPNLFQSDDPSDSAVEGPIDPEEDLPTEDLGPVGFTVQ